MDVLGDLGSKQAIEAIEDHGAQDLQVVADGFLKALAGMLDSREIHLTITINERTPKV
jgi:hypothetical protein